MLHRRLSQKYDVSHPSYSSAQLHYISPDKLPGNNRHAHGSD